MSVRRRDVDVPLAPERPRLAISTPTAASGDPETGWNWLVSPGSAGQAVAHGQEVVDPDRGVRGHVHAAPGRDDRDRRAADHPVGAARELQRGPVGGRRLRPDPGVGPADRGIAGRPLRAAPPLHHRPHRLHPRFAALWGGPVADHADPLPQRPGHRWGDPLRHVAGAAGPELPWP